MLSATVPFKANNLNDLHNLIIKGTFDEIQDISKDATPLVHALLETNPKQRITLIKYSNILGSIVRVVCGILCTKYLGNPPPSVTSITFFKSHSINSNTKVIFAVPRRRQMLMWFNSVSKHISRIAVEGIPSSLP